MEIDDFISEWRSENDYVEAHTSGSTGKPKQIRLLKSDMRVSAAATCKFFGITASSTVAMALSVDYIAGKMMTVRALESGARIIQLPVKNRFEISSPIDLLAIVPSQIQNFIEHPRYASMVKNLLIGGAAPSEDDCHQLSLLGYRFFISYGMTETCSHVALADGHDHRRIFKALPGISFETDEDGRLTIIAPAFSFKRLKTNDIVELISPDRFRWRGRADGIINSGGIKLVPEEIESLYASLLTPRRYYVTHQPDPKWGQALVLVIEMDDADIPLVMDRLRLSVADHRRLPKRIIAVTRLPEASNGKIRRLKPEDLV